MSPDEASQDSEPQQFKRSAQRAAAKGTVWLMHKSRMVAAGSLLDLSDTGLRYRHDPASRDIEGFPLPAPAQGQIVALAVTLHHEAPEKPVEADVLRAAPASDGAIEVGCRFAARDASETKLIHRKYVDASLERARKSLATSRAKLFNQPDPSRRKRERIGEILVRRKAIDTKDLNRFLDGNRGGVPLGLRLVKAGLVSTRQLAEALSEHMGLPFVDLDATGVEDQALRRVKPGTALQLGTVAFAISSRRLKIASSRPLTREEREELEAQARLRVIPHLADQEQIERILKGSAEGKRRKRLKAGIEILVRYRFYGAAMEQLDPRTFEGAAANLSDTGILFGGPVPQAIADAFQKQPAPRIVVAAQLIHGGKGAPVTLRFEPVRITPMPSSEDSAREPGAPTCWIGARISPLVAEDRKHLLRLCEDLREE